MTPSRRAQLDMFVTGGEYYKGKQVRGHLPRSYRRTRACFQAASPRWHCMFQKGIERPAELDVELGEPLSCTDATPRKKLARCPQNASGLRRLKVPSSRIDLAEFFPEFVQYCFHDAERQGRPSPVLREHAHVDMRVAVVLRRYRVPTKPQTELAPDRRAKLAVARAEGC